MKLIIDIDKDILTDAKNGHIRLSEIADAVIKTGTPINIGGDTISREDLKKALHNFFDGKVIDEPAYILRDVFCYIDGAPTVTIDNYSMGYQDGVRKVLSEKPKGEWIKIDPYPLQMHEFKCSECGYETDDCTDNFCSYCGARMRGEND